MKNLLKDVIKYKIIFQIFSQCICVSLMWENPTFYYNIIILPIWTLISLLSIFPLLLRILWWMLRFPATHHTESIYMCSHSLKWYSNPTQFHFPWFGFLNFQIEEKKKKDRKKYEELSLTADKRPSVGKGNHLFGLCGYVSSSIFHCSFRTTKL